MSKNIVDMFRAIGAEVEIRNEKFPRVIDRHTNRPVFGRNRWQIEEQTPVRVDVQTVDDRERFDIAYDGRGATLRVVDVDRHRQHLLLAVSTGASGEAEKFLCGFDERHWFSAAVPSKGVYSIDTAMDALMPGDVRAELDQHNVTGDQRYRRKNEAFVRQGEWFFVPTNRSLKGLHTRAREPLQRSADGKPHVLEFAVRFGGTAVYICASRDLAFSRRELDAYFVEHPGARGWLWEKRLGEPELYTRGRVWHPDHATLHLGRWHRVHVNEEHRAPSRRNLRFID